MSEGKIVWIVQLPSEWKSIFESIAKENNDIAYGSGVREVKRVLLKFIRNLGLSDNERN